MEQQASLPPLTTPKFVTFPVAHDPNFGDTDTHDVDSDPLWKEAAVSVVNDPEDTRQKRLEELRDELKRRSIKLCPGDKNQLLAMLRAGQGQVARALHVIEVFLQYQQYEKNGMLEVCYVSMLCKHYVHIKPNTQCFSYSIIQGLPSHVEPMLRNTLKDFVVLPHRDKYGRRIVVFKVVLLCTSPDTPSLFLWVGRARKMRKVPLDVICKLCGFVRVLCWFGAVLFLVWSGGCVGLCGSCTGAPLRS